MNHLLARLRRNKPPPATETGATGAVKVAVVPRTRFGAWLGRPMTSFHLVVAVAALLITLGLFLLVINSLLLWLTSWVAGELQLGWHVDGFMSAFWGALIVSVVSFILNASFTSKSDVHR